MMRWFRCAAADRSGCFHIAPRVRRAAVLADLNPAVLVGIPQFEAIAAVAPSFGVEMSRVNVRDTDEIERAIMAVARDADGGLIVTASTSSTLHRDLIVTLAARLRLPAVYPNLISYGPLFVDQYRQAADYVDRILKGEEPADLPVQAPSRYETVINLKTAKAVGLAMPRILLARADELID